MVLIFFISFLFPLIPLLELRKPNFNKKKAGIVAFITPIYTYSLPVLLQMTPLGRGGLVNWIYEAVIMNTVVGVIMFLTFKNSKISAITTKVLLIIVPLAFAVALKILIPSLPD
jgi:hypothetical protein